MSDFAHAYVHRASAGDEAAARTFLDAADAELDRLYTQGALEGYQVLLIDGQELAAEELIPTARVSALVAAPYPYVFVRIQPKDDDVGAACDQRLAELDCPRIA